MIIRRFSIITATVTVVLSDNHQFHCTACSSAQLNFALTWNTRSLSYVVTCCINLGKKITILLYWSLVDKTSDMKSQQDLGWVSKPSKLKDHNAYCISQEKQDLGIFICPCWNELERCHTWTSNGTSCSHSGSKCSKPPNREVLPSM